MTTLRTTCALLFVLGGLWLAGTMLLPGSPAVAALPWVVPFPAYIAVEVMRGKR